MQHRLRELYVGSVVAIAASFFAAWLFEVFNNGVHNDVLEGVTILGAAALMLYVSGWLLLRQDPELLAVRTIALPGAAGQIALVSVLGIAVAYALGWSIGGGIVFGLALSVASTAVVLHALQQRRLVETDRGRIAVGWLGGWSKQTAAGSRSVGSSSRTWLRPWLSFFSPHLPDCSVGNRWSRLPYAAAHKDAAHWHEPTGNTIHYRRRPIWDHFRAGLRDLARPGSKRSGPLWSFAPARFRQGSARPKKGVPLAR